MINRLCMNTSRSLRVLGVVLAVGVAPLSAACVVEEEIPPPVVAEGYSPVFYDGYVVYFDEVGRPFYYVNGAVVWVPPTSPLYLGLVEHWRVHGPAYRNWYARHGERYRAYRGRRR